MVLWGEAATISHGLKAHLEAGAYQVCIQHIHADGELNARDRTLTALANSEPFESARVQKV
jgi:hypothetical protein